MSNYKKIGNNFYDTTSGYLTLVNDRDTLNSLKRGNSGGGNIS